MAIVGGGISGLSAAVTLEDARRKGAAIEYTLLESAARLGGVLRTEKVEGCVVEAGPDSFLTEKSWAAEFCRSLGIGEDLIFSNDAERKTYIAVNGRLIAMPDGLQFMVPTRIFPIALSPLFSLGTKLRMAKEYFLREKNGTDAANSAEDESVAGFIGRHFGQEMVDRLADPLLAGVYGGDAASLSARSVMPRFVELEQRHGSLSRGLFRSRKQREKGDGKAGAPRPIFTSLRNGMQQMAEAAAAHLEPRRVQVNDPVRAVRRESDGWRVIGSRSATEVFESLIVATPAGIAAKLLEAVDGSLASELGQIPYSSSVTVALGFEKKALASAPPGFGFLTPRAEGRRMLACTFVHAKFPHRAPPQTALLRCFLGGSHDPAVLDLPDEELLRIVRQELRELIHVDAEPVFWRVYRWRQAMAQYAPGHGQRMAKIRALQAGHPGLELAGNAYRGIGLPDCIASGRQAALDALKKLGLTGAAE
ncbi:MAG TPA: protoporphyrinogen oxidase [Terriglobales bacterium]|nr:protoporphyrinogen oxidase [Terriglobales bacterium]